MLTDDSTQCVAGTHSVAGDVAISSDRYYSPSSLHRQCRFGTSIPLGKQRVCLFVQCVMMYLFHRSAPVRVLAGGNVFTGSSVQDVVLDRHRFQPTLTRYGFWTVDWCVVCVLDLLRL